MVAELLGLTIVACIALVVIVVIVFLVFFLLFKFVIEFFPSILVAGLVFWFTRDFILTVVAFLASAIIFGIMGWHWRRSRRRY